jgi:hypothetical protein
MRRAETGGATGMALRWDCDAAFPASTVPPQGHYSVYHVGMSCLQAGQIRPIRARVLYRLNGAQARQRTTSQTSSREC